VDEVSRLGESVESRLLAEMAAAEKKATDSLSRYKFVMFGYWAGVWVHLNRTLGARHQNPWQDLVKWARRGDK